MSGQSDRLFLEETCASLQQKLTQKLVDDKDFQEQDFQDFEVNYGVSSDEGILQLQIRYPFLQEVLKHGSQELLELVWEGLPLKLSIEPGCLGIAVSSDKLGEDLALRERCVQQLLLTRVWLLIGPLWQRLKWLQESTQSSSRNTTVAFTGAVPPILELQVRQLEICWIVCKSDRVVILFTIHLDDEVDVSLGRAFCQEFAETGRNPSESSLPCTFTEPKDGVPTDLRGVKMQSMPNVGFLSLTISDQCVRNASQQRLFNLAQPVMTFRNFFNFHLKNAKSYLHSRLRKRMDGWQMAMNRAKRVPRKGQEAKRRTVGGKEFVPNPRG